MATQGTYKGTEIKAGDQASVQSQIRAVDAAQAPAPVTPQAASSASRPIRADIISPVTATYSPPPAPLTSSTQIAVSSVADRKDPSQQGGEMTRKQQLLKDYMDRISPNSLQDDKARLRSDAGLESKMLEANRLQSDLASRKRAYEDEIERLEKNPQGTFGGALATQVADLRRKANKELADIAIQAEFALNNYQGAERILQAQIEDLDQDFDNQIKTYEIAADFLTNDLSESEKQQIQFQQQELMAQRDFERDKLKAEFEQKLRQSDPMYQAQLQNERLQGRKLSQDINESVVNPEVAVVQAKDKINNIDSIIGAKGLSDAVGSTFLSRLSGGKNTFSGEKGNFLAGVQQLASTLTLDNLINAKANGATFGALSEGELKLIDASASKIKTWAKTDKDGNYTAIKTSEKLFKEELDKINNFAKRDYLLKGGDPADVGVQVMSDGTAWAKNSDGTLTQIY